MQEERGTVGERNMYRYYLTQRPPMPGAMPAGFSLLNDYGEIRNRQICGVLRNVYGWVEYDQPLTAEQIREYELTAEEEPLVRLKTDEEIGKTARETLRSIKDILIRKNQELSQAIERNARRIREIDEELKNGGTA